MPVTSPSHIPSLPSSSRWALTSLALSMLLSSLGISIANVSLPTLAQAFATSFQAVQWVVLAYLLVITTLIVSVGRLGDLIGRRRLLLAGILLFTLASLLCGLAPSLGLLIAARVLQGLGAAMMMALTLAFVGETVPKARTASAIGLLGSMSAIGTAMGPSLGGLLISLLGWRAIFLLSLPLGLLTLGLAYRHLPLDQPVRQAGRQGFDPMGTVLLSLTLAAYALSMTLGQGRFDLLNVQLLLAAVIGAGLFAWVETRVASPLLRLALLRDPVLSSNLIMSALVATVMMATLVVGPFYLAQSLGLDTARVGLVMSSGPLVAALSSAPGGRLADRFGPQRMTRYGLAGMSVGSLGLATLPATAGIYGYVLPLVCLTGSYALFQTANNSAVMTGVEAQQRGVISGLLSLSRNLGLITGAALMGAIFALASNPATGATPGAGAIAHGMRVTFVVALALIVAALFIAYASQRQVTQTAQADNLG